MRTSQAFVAVILATGVKSVPEGLLEDDWTLPGIPLSLFMNEETKQDLFVDARSANKILAAPIDMASDNARNLLTSDLVRQIAYTDYLPQTTCSDDEAEAWEGWSKRSPKPSGEFCSLDEAPIICPSRGGLSLRRKTPSCCTGLETIERYPYGAGRIPSRSGCECVAHLPNVLRWRPKLIFFSNRSVRCSEFCFVQKEKWERILLRLRGFDSGIYLSYPNQVY